MLNVLEHKSFSNQPSQPRRYLFHSFMLWYTFGPLGLPVASFQHAFFKDGKGGQVF